MTSPRASSTRRRVVLRALAGVLLVTAYLLTRDALGPRALVSARFGLGVALFGLLVDAARVLVGEGTPLQGELAPHRQQAEPIVDDRYERVHEPVTRFVDEGVWTSAYDAVLEDAFEAVQAPGHVRRTVLDQARETARAERPAGEPVASALLAGLIVSTGCAVAIARLLALGGRPVFGPLLVVLGLGLGATQLRVRGPGGRWTAAGLGALGAGLVTLGAFQTTVAYPGPWELLVGLAAVLLVASLGLALTGEPARPPWPRLRERLETRFERLRRAFLGVLLAGGVLFPLEPLLEELATGIGLPFQGPYQVATILYVTLAAYLAVELAGTWYGLSRGRRRATRQRRQRVDANRAILDVLDEHAPRREDEPA